MVADLLSLGLTYIPPIAGGAGAMWLKQWLGDRSSDRRIDRETKFLALEVADMLEKFASSATTVASNISEHEDDEQDGVRVDIATLPDFPETHERWRDLNLKIADAIFRLKDTHHAFNRTVRSVFDYVDPYQAEDEARILNILLAVEALAVAAKIRKRYKHARFDTKAHWPVYLSEQYAKIPKTRKEKVANSFRKQRWWQR